MGLFEECVQGLEDPRWRHAVRHDLLEGLMMALCAMLCGAESCVDIEDFSRAKEPLLRRFLRLEHGILSLDPFARLFRALDPIAVQDAFADFMARFAEAGAGVVDGKTARRSFDRAAGRSALHTISAWACEPRLVLGRRAVPADGTEIAALPALLALLDLKGGIVTAAAMHCQRATAQAIVEHGGDYVLVLKANQPALLEGVRLFLDDPQAPPDDRVQMVEGDHGRIETRVCEVVHDVAFLNDLHGWPGLRAIGRITAIREVAGQVSQETRHCLLSRPLSAARLAAGARVHWTIENQRHWPLDVHLDEDGDRTRQNHGPENLALMRRFALNLLRANRDKLSVRRKIKQAGWNDAFLLKLLAQA